MPSLQQLSAVIADLQSSLGMSKEVLAIALGVNSRTVDRWCEDGNFPQREARKHLEELVALKDHLYSTFGTKDAVLLWMTTDNNYIGGLKPIEVAKSGRIDRIEAALTALDYGAFV